MTQFPGSKEVHIKLTKRVIIKAIEAQRAIPTMISLSRRPENGTNRGIIHPSCGVGWERTFSQRKKSLPRSSDPWGFRPLKKVSSSPPPPTPKCPLLKGRTMNKSFIYFTGFKLENLVHGSEFWKGSIFRNKTATTSKKNLQLPPKFSSKCVGAKTDLFKENLRNLFHFLNLINDLTGLFIFILDIHGLNPTILYKHN